MTRDAKRHLLDDWAPVGKTGVAGAMVMVTVASLPQATPRREAAGASGMLVAAAFPMRHGAVPSVFTIDVANSVFLVCLVVGGVLLLVTVLLDDILGGLLDAIHLDFDLGGVTLMPLLLAFVAMFGVGGLIGTQALGLSGGAASLLGGVSGLAGAAIVFLLFSALRRAEAPQAFSLTDLVGRTGRVSVGIRANRNGSILLSYGGASYDLTASAAVDVPAGAPVTVIEVTGGTLIVRPLDAAQGGTTDA